MVLSVNGDPANQGAAQPCSIDSQVTILIAFM